MKRILIISLLLIVAMGVWAKTGGETKPLHDLHYSQTEIPYEVESTLQIEPSADIVAIFADEDNDVDELFEDAEKFLYKDADRRTIPRDVKDYIEKVLADDADDVRDLIHDELEQAIKDNGVEKTFMILGTQMFSCNVDYLH